MNDAAIVREDVERPEPEPLFDDDATLARRVASAGPLEAAAAEAALYRRLAPRVRLYGLRHLRDTAAADDLVQEVLLVTLESLRAGRVREPERLASFVLGTCRLMVTNLRRGIARRRELLERFGGDLPAAYAEPLPFENDGRLASCLAALPAREREILRLSFRDEAPAATIGARLGLSEGNVRVVRHRALAKLRDCLKGGRA